VRTLLLDRAGRTILAALMLLSGCGVVATTSADGPSGSPTDLAAEADEHDEHGEYQAGEAHAEHQDQRTDEGGADEPAPGTTAATLAQMRAMDPAHLASLHDHGDGHDHAHRAVDHPNGIDPERIVIPAIGVDADVIDLGLEDDGSMEVPTDFSQTGWFDRGPKPGRVGPAVIAGHVDDRTGPAVFFRLAELEPGDLIEVHGEDGEIVVFAVRESEQHPKDAFPTEEVYAGTPGSELRLITCGGAFDRDARSYRDNFIVYAERVED
jgi:hypothetical protein